MNILKWFGIGLVSLLLLIFVYVFISYQSNMNEHLTLNDEVRENAPGQFIQLTDGYTHYQLTGADDAPTIVLVHGFSIPMAIWGTTHRRLQQAGYRVLAYDLFGRGYSDRPRVQYTGELFERQLQELLDGLNIEGPVVLAGLSMGGPIVMRFAANHSHRVLGTVLIAPLHQPLQPPPMPERIGHVMLGAFYVPSIQQSFAAEYLTPEDATALRTAYTAQTEIRGFTQALTSSFYAFSTQDHREYYRRTREYGVPMMLVWGTNDNVVPYSHAEGVQEDALVLHMITAEGAGHTPHLEQPELVNGYILAFLQDLTLE
ncbi:MAG: alpha/beta hydrolase [Idiomarina sp.]|nr:alpha/beta hydrolase [Idiomarina sp.]